MKPHLTMEQYRNIDLILFLLMLVVSETLILVAATRWFPDQLYTVSVAAAITAIVMVRWKGFSLIHAVAAGVIMCIVMGGSPQQYLIYTLGNAFSILALLFVRKVGTTRIRKSPLLRIVFGVSVLFLMQTGRMAIALILGNPIETGVEFYLTDSLSYIFTAVILWIAGKQDGMLEDQKDYVIRINEASEEAI